MTSYGLGKVEKGGGEAWLVTLPLELMLRGWCGFPWGGAAVDGATRDRRGPDCVCILVLVVAWW